MPDRRYLAHRVSFARQAMARLAEVDDLEPDTLDDAVVPAGGDEPDEQPVPLVIQRHGAVVAALRAAGAGRVLDLGCGSGALLAALVKESALTEIVGVDVSARALEAAARRLHLDRLPERQRARLTLLQGALTYTDARLRGYDAAVLMEVVEHLEPDRLPALERTVFADAAPGTVLVTTPNVEHNVRFQALLPGGMRHRDHRFEWTRAEFTAWATGVAARHGYVVRFLGIGTDDPEVGPPTQMAVFTRGAAAGEDAA
jgi:3' terminal RNA ribose 2'-O-methyltransferase Hen1